MTSVALLAGPLCLRAVTLLAVMAINHARYGVFLLNDLHAGAFPAPTAR